MIWNQLINLYAPALNVLLQLLFSRILFASVLLSVSVALIMFVRKKLAPAARSWLWALCIPILIIPIERSVAIFSQSINLSDNIVFHAVRLVIMTVCHVWLIGVIISAVKVHRNRKKTMRLLIMGKINGSAAYYHKWRSHIYTPPNFEEEYTPDERKMLLAHEGQHIRQFDPLLFNLLQGLQCVFWFNPLVHRAIRLIRHDRELLCDERVTAGCSKHDYGRLLLSEAQKNLTAHPMPGIASDKAGVYERVAACVTPFSRNRKCAVAVACVVAVLFSLGSVGFVAPRAYAPAEVFIIESADESFTHISEFQEFILLTQDGVVVDRIGLYEHATALGFMPEQELSVVIMQQERTALVSDVTLASSFTFAISELTTDDTFIPCTTGSFRLLRFLFWIL